MSKSSKRLDDSERPNDQIHAGDQDVITYDNLYHNYVAPVLEEMQMYTLPLATLLVGTAAHESEGGRFVKQVDGPAVGLYQMEPRTHDDLWKDMSPKLQQKIYKVSGYTSKPDAAVMEKDHKYSTIMAAVFYMRFKQPIPQTLMGQACYYKQYWNTRYGAATPEEFVNDYERYTKPHRAVK